MSALITLSGSSGLGLTEEEFAAKLKRLEVRLNAQAALWGLISEEVFREGLRGLLEEELGLKVERWETFDEEGLVYGYPRRVEIDVAIHDGKAVLVEVKAHVNASDVYAFRRKAELYEKKAGERPSRLLMVTPYAEDEGLQAAKHLNIEVYTKI